MNPRSPWSPIDPGSPNEYKINKLLHKYSEDFKEEAQLRQLLLAKGLTKFKLEESSRAMIRLEQGKAKAKHRPYDLRLCKAEGLVPECFLKYSPLSQFPAKIFNRNRRGKDSLCVRRAFF
jgi:hypothetical protein